MKSLEVSTVTYVEADEAYEFLLDFPGYAEYTDYITDVTQDGDGGAGTGYEIEFSWWRLSYTAETEVTNVDSPTEMEWEVQKDIDAKGKWLVEELDEDDFPEDAPEDATDACEVTLVIYYDDGSVSSDAINLPRFVSLGTVIKKVTPIVSQEGEKVVERVVEDLEGEERDVDLNIDFEKPDPDAV